MRNTCARNSISPSLLGRLVFLLLKGCFVHTHGSALRRRLELPTSGCAFRIRSLFKKWPLGFGCKRGAIFWSAVRARGGRSLRIRVARFLDPVSTGCEITAYATLIGGGAFDGRLALALAVAFDHCRRKFAEKELKIPGRNMYTKVHRLFLSEWQGRPNAQRNGERNTCNTAATHTSQSEVGITRIITRQHHTVMSTHE